MSISEPLPPPHYLRLPSGVTRVPAGASWRITVTSRNAVTCWTHFIDGRTTYCRAPEHDCEACSRAGNRRYESYVSVWNHSREVEGVLMLPALAWSVVAADCGGEWQGRLRGRRYKLIRPGEDARGKLLVEPLGPTPDGERIHRGLDVPAILERMWRLPAGFLRP